MDIETFVHLADEYAALGSAVQSQLSSVIAGEPVADQNPNAMRFCLGFLAHAARCDVIGADDLAEWIENVQRRIARHV